MGKKRLAKAPQEVRSTCMYNYIGGIISVYGSLTKVNYSIN